MLRINLKLDDLLESYLQAAMIRDRFVIAIISPFDFITSLSTIEKLKLVVEDTAGAVATIAECEDLAELKSLTHELQNIAGLKFTAWGRGILVGSNLHWDENAEVELLSDWKPPVLIDIQRSRHNIPIVPVGGGAYSSRCFAHYVMNSRKQLKRALFIRKSGHLANATDMALVPITANDIIVRATGIKPFSFDNPDFEIKAYKVVLIKETMAECVDISDRLDMSFIPDSVVVGAQRYHNRSAEYFCSGLAGSDKKKKSDDSH